VLTATSLSYEKAKNSTSHRIETPDRIEIKLGSVDYVGEGTRHAKFHANLPKGIIECCQRNFAATFPGCHGNEIWDKMGYDWASTRDICEIFASIKSFSGLNHQILPMKFCRDLSWLPWQQNLKQNGL